MEYITLIILFVLSIFLAYFIIKVKLLFYKKMIINLFLLLVCGCIMIITGIKETSFLIYVLLLILTLLGILMHIIAPFVLNLIGILLSKIQKEKYTVQTYDEFMQEGHRMYFCVLIFTTLKVWLYIALGASFLSII